MPMWWPGALQVLVLLSARGLLQDEAPPLCAPGCTCEPGRLECPSAGVAGGAETLTFEGVPLRGALAAAGPSPFRGLSALRRLALRRCELNALLPRTFQPLRALRELDLSDNMLSAVPARTFSECAELYKVVLSGNPLGSAPALRLQPLGWLELDRCALVEVPDTAFVSTPALYYISLRRNPQLETLPIGVFTPLIKLSHVHLEGSGIRTLPLHLFRDNPMLQTLYLSGNPLELPEEGPFLWSESLLILDLSACHLERLPPGVFSRLPELRSLLLADNNLTALPPAVFDRLPHLKILDLRNNRLAELDVGATLQVLRFKRDAVLDVCGNPASAQCACALLRCRAAPHRCFMAASGVRLDDDLCSDAMRASCQADLGQRERSGRLGLPPEDDGEDNDEDDEDEDAEEGDVFAQFAPDEAPNITTLLRAKAAPAPPASVAASMHTKVAMGVGGALVVAALILATVCFARWLRRRGDDPYDVDGEGEAAAPMNSPAAHPDVGWTVMDPDAIRAIDDLAAATAAMPSTSFGAGTSTVPRFPTTPRHSSTPGHSTAPGPSTTPGDSTTSRYSTTPRHSSTAPDPCTATVPAVTTRALQQRSRKVQRR